MYKQTLKTCQLASILPTELFFCEKSDHAGHVLRTWVHIFVWTQNINTACATKDRESKLQLNSGGSDRYIKHQAASPLNLLWLLSLQCTGCFNRADIMPFWPWFVGLLTFVTIENVWNKFRHLPKHICLSSAVFSIQWRAPLWGFCNTVGNFDHGPQDVLWTCLIFLKSC